VSALLGWVRGLPAPSAAANGGVGTCQAPLPIGDSGAVHWITQEQAKGLVGNPGVAFVDCRERAQFEAGHVTGSLHLQLSGGQVAPSLFDTLARMSTVITYCGGQGECARSMEMASLLHRSGLEDVRVLEGGMPVWLNLGYPAESGSCRDCEQAMH
jgi:rhodanese-related sulfurtransferase